MQVFFDTSVVVPLLLEEEGHSGPALELWQATETGWAWHWLRMETEAALLRRRAPAEAWREWRALSGHFRWVDLQPSEFAHLSSFNRGLALRAADAAHLFLCTAVAEAVDRLVLATFDSEMDNAARQLGLDVWPPSARLP